MRGIAGAALAGLLGAAAGRAGAACLEGDCQDFDCGQRCCAGGREVNDFFPSTTECRPAVGPGDAAEFCTGRSLSGPADAPALDGTPCPGNGNPCIDDVCRNGQCAHLPNNGPCPDDGNPCTLNVCVAGACTHPPAADGTACGPGLACQAGQRRCAGATCGAICADLKTDPANCGACGRACAAGQTCCAGACRALGRDKRNCGRCGHHCRPGQRCHHGRCR